MTTVVVGRIAVLASGVVRLADGGVLRRCRIRVCASVPEAPARAAGVGFFTGTAPVGASGCVGRIAGVRAVVIVMREVSPQDATNQHPTTTTLRQSPRRRSESPFRRPRG